MNTKMDSIESVKEGIKQGADIIEIDLNIDKDNDLVLSHNTPDDFKNYPSLSDVINLISTEEEILLNIDVKNIRLINKIKEIISKDNMKERVFLTGIKFEDIIDNLEEFEGINYFINIDEEYLTVKNIENIITCLKYMKPLGINIDYNLITSEIIRACKDNDLLISVWTVDDKSEMEKLINMGVDSITTKRVDLLKSITADI